MVTELLTKLQFLLENYYHVFVDYGPIITIIGFFGFYGIMIFNKHKTKNGSTFDRYAFLLLFMALLPNFFAHMALALVHSAWSPFIAEVVNIVPVIYYLIINEYYLKK